jgi:hypothetical protein
VCRGNAEGRRSGSNAAAGVQGVPPPSAHIGTAFAGTSCIGALSKLLVIAQPLPSPMASASHTAAAAGPVGSIWSPDAQFCPRCGTLLVLPDLGDVRCDKCSYTCAIDGALLLRQHKGA